MHNKKRSRKVLSKQLLSMDFGLMAPPESESSDDDMFTGIMAKRYLLDIDTLCIFTTYIL